MDPEKAIGYYCSTDSTLRRLNGRPITSLAPLDESLYDKHDVGPMFEAVISGETVHVFEDEIRPTKERS